MIGIVGVYFPSKLYFDMVFQLYILIAIYTNIILKQIYIVER